MDRRLRWLAALICVAAVEGAQMLDVVTSSGSVGSGGRSANMAEAGLSHTLRQVYAQCAAKDDLFWCLKVQSARLLGRALKVQQIHIVDGISMVKRADNETRTGRASATESSLSSRELESLSVKSLDALLVERFLSFVQSRQVQVNLPRLFAFGERNSQDLLGALLRFFSDALGEEPGSADDSEGRGKKKDDKKYLGPFIAAVMLKAAILKMAYHSIAIVAGKALIVGKIALIISAIIGLKKLVSSDGGEKTTYEIVKHPQVQQSHTYSSSHSGEYEGGHDSGSYHRSMDDEMVMQDKAYHAWVPTTKAS